jgi:hydrogenase maturation protease
METRTIRNPKFVGERHGTKGAHKILVIGFGNPYRGDDAVGNHVAQKLKEQNLLNVTIIEESGEAITLLDKWQGHNHVILVDAVSSGAAVGTIHRFNASSRRIPAKYFRHSTHTISLAEAIELARTMNQLPTKLIVFGIEGKKFDAGTEMSPKVRKAAEKVTEKIVKEIQNVHY